MKDRPLLHSTDLAEINRGFNRLCDLIEAKSSSKTSSSPVGTQISNLVPTGGASSASSFVFPVLTGDAENVSGNTSITITGIHGSPVPALSAGFLKYSGSAWIFDPTTYVQEAPLDGKFYGRKSGAWANPASTDLSDFPSAYVTGLLKWSGSAWVFDTNTYLADAASDGIFRGRKNGAWVRPSASDLSDAPWAEAGKFTAGVLVLPTLVDAGSGNVTVGAGGTFNLYSSATAICPLVTYTLPTQTLAIPDLTNCWVCASYNGGTPTYVIITDYELLHASRYSTVIPVWYVYRGYGELYTYDFDTNGVHMCERMLDRINEVEKFKVAPRPNAFAMAATSGLQFSVATGEVWNGVTYFELAQFLSASMPVDLFEWNGSGYNRTTIHDLNGTQYQGASAFASLGSGKYGTRWIWRKVGSDAPRVAMILGAENGNLAAAQAASFPLHIPDVVNQIGVFIGRAIVQQGNTTPVQFDTAFGTTFAPSGISNHNDLSLRDAADCHPVGAITNLFGYAKRISQWRF